MATKDENQDELHLDQDLRHIINSLADVKHWWYRIGVQLGLPISALDRIQFQHKSDDDTSEAFIEMLKKWFKMDTAHTWTAIVKALKSADLQEDTLADDILKKYITCTRDKPLAAPARSVSVPGESYSGDVDTHISVIKRSTSEGAKTHQNSTLSVTASVQQEIAPQRSSHPIQETESSEKFSYPFLDTNKMSKDKKDALQGRLTNDYQAITSEYSKLLNGIRNSLTERHITPKQLAGVLMGLNAFVLIKKSHSSEPLLEDCLDDIEKAENVYAVFKSLLPYISFFDCHVIRHIVTSDLCTEDDNQKMQIYSNKLDDYCKRYVYECPHISSLHANLARLVMKVEDIVTSRFTMKALQALRDKVARTLNLEAHTLHICSVQDGCLQLTCQIPPFTKKKIFPLSHQQKEELQSLGIQQLTCDDVVHFISTPTATTRSPVPLTLESQETPQNYSTWEGKPSTGRLGTGRYCYVHLDGVTVKEGFFEFQQPEIGDSSKSCTIKVKLPTDNERYKSRGLLCQLESDSGFEQTSTSGLSRQQSLYYIGENQERALGRPLQTFLMATYVKDIEQKLQESLSWMHERRLKPKLEGRFGKLCWRKVPGSELSTEMYTPENFVRQAFESAASYFYTRIGEESSAAVREMCSMTGGLIDETESYDFKLKTAHGKLDVRVKFNVNGIPEVLSIKKAEYKVAIFDILCLNRQYDMRVSLNNYEVTSSENPVVKEFLSTLSMTAPRTVTFASKASNDEWIVDLIRHKEVQTHFLKPPQFVVTISTVRQIEVNNKDGSDTVSCVCVDSTPSHSEIELHNLSWDVSFGHMLGFKPEESLMLFMKPEKIPVKVVKAAQEQWTPEWIMEDFVKSGFMKMLESMNETMDLQAPVH